MEYAKKIKWKKYFKNWKILESIRLYSSIVACPSSNWRSELVSLVLFLDRIWEHFLFRPCYTFGESSQTTCHRRHLRTILFGVNLACCFWGACCHSGITSFRRLGPLSAWRIVTNFCCSISSLAALSCFSLSALFGKTYHRCCYCCSYLAHQLSLCHRERVDPCRVHLTTFCLILLQAIYLRFEITLQLHIDFVYCLVVYWNAG